MVHHNADHPALAEEAYNHALAIEVRLGNQTGQARTLTALGALYGDVLQLPEEAVAFYRRAGCIYNSTGDNLKEGIAWSNLSHTLHKCQRLEEAREAIYRAIQCKKAFGHAAKPWKTWSILADIETDANNPAAATEARQKARAAYLAYRRDGGENDFPNGRLVQAIHQAITTGNPAEAALLIPQLSLDPRASSTLSFLTALQSITGGSYDSSLAEDQGLHYSEAAEVMLLIEILEAGAEA
jgi:tetratricopeptide (TPR) repeat protein